MPPTTACAPIFEPATTSRTPAELLCAYEAHLSITARGNIGYYRSARAFLARWPSPQDWADRPLTARLATDDQTRPFVAFLMVTGMLRPGYDYLAARKLSSIWRDIPPSPLAADVDRFTQAATELGYTATGSKAIASQVLIRLLIQTGRPMQALTRTDLNELRLAVTRREAHRARRLRHYRQAIHATGTVLFHLGVLPDPPPVPEGRRPHAEEDRLAGTPTWLLSIFLAYLDHRRGTCCAGTVSHTVSRLAHFGRHLGAIDPGLGSLADLDRQRHIEPYLTALTTATRPRDGARIAVSERRARVITVSRFLADITEWGWPQAPAHQLIFGSDIPRLPRPLPRYLPPQVDRRLTDQLRGSPNRQAADALLLQRACGLRIGELLDLELDCIHEIDGLGAWLKVPLGKLDTERMVPIDTDTLTLVDQLAADRSSGQPLPHPRTGRPTEFLLLRHGQRLSATGLRNELRRAAAAAGLGEVTPHQLRHTYATALVNAGCSLQALMALLGHQSANMSLRYGRLFDATVRADYQRALELAKDQLGPVLPSERTSLPLNAITAGPWQDAPLIKARHAGGYCLRTPAQGVCPYTNICEHCPNHRTDASFLAVLGAQRADALALAADAEHRGWDSEAARHHALIARLDQLMNQANPA
jgi:integrase